MSRSAIWKWGSIAAIFVMLAATVAVFHAQTFAAGGPTAAQKTGRTILTGERIPALKGAKVSSIAFPVTKNLSFSVDLQLRNQASLAKLLQEQNDRSSSMYHHYLTPDQFTAQFGPTAKDVAAVTNFLRSEHLVVDSIAPNHLIIDAHGSGVNVERAFGAQLGYFNLHGRTVFAPKGDVSVPSALAGVILNVAGLDDVAHYHPLLTDRMQQTPNIKPDPGPGGGYTPSELRTAYDMNSLISSDNGTGQTVAIFELDGYVPADVNTYLSNYSLGSAKYSNVLVDGATNTAGAGAIEVELDMEVVSAIAPGATQHIYIGPNSTSGVNDTYNKIVTDDTAKVSSTSWGECESAAGTSELQAEDNIFTQGAAQGQAFFAAAGDSGAYDCDDTNLAVDNPADDPHVVGVGGTTLTTGSGGSYSSETVWSCSSCSGRGPNGTGGGGGLSTYFAQPSYQSGPGVSNSYSNGNREVPDVSADADPNSGYSVYCTVAAAGCSSGSAGWIVVGGTSAAAPLWAGSITDSNQYLAGLSKPTFGSASSTLYTLFNTSQTYSAYHDVTTGNNLYYPATSGYDLASGIGTPDVWNLARDASGGSGGGTNDFSISASPTSISIAQGNNGTATISTAVTSGSAGTVSLSASVSPSGPTASLNPTSVTAGNSSTLTISVGSSVSTGSYTVTVTGTEGTKTHNATVAVTVTSSGGGGGGITNGGFETGSLSGWTASGAATGISTTAHSGSYSAQLGLSTPTNGDSTISQTFTVPSGDGTLSFWYQVRCPDTVTYDWATASLKDNTSNTTTTLLPKTCNNNATWVQVTTSVTAGHSLTLTLTSHDDNYYADPTYTLYDDVALSAAVSNPIVNGGFETGSLSGWTASGAATGISTTAHSGSYSAQLGLSTPTNGDSTISQTFTAPSGTSTLSFWYNVNCPDTVTYDWATATLKDNTANTTKTVLAKTCNNNGTWVQVTTSVTAGHSYTLTLTSHDDNYYADPTYTLYDDVKVS